MEIRIYGKKGKEYKVVLYKKGKKKKLMELPFTNLPGTGDERDFSIERLSDKEFEYCLTEDGKPFEDAYARVVNGCEKWGKRGRITYSVLERKYWLKNYKRLDIPMEECIMYKLHVRGFTKSKTSGVEHPGTFMGIIDKIPYFKELGVNTLLLMPAYEFNEVMIDKTNYWGYTDAHYFAPKAAYGTGEGNVSDEFKKMVDTLHENGIQVFMEFYFVPGTNPLFITRCLEFWSKEYLIDGIKVNLNVAHVNILKKDAKLTDVKIIGDNWNMINDCPEENDAEKRFSVDDGGFMINARRFLKGENGQVEGIAKAMVAGPTDYGIINYLATHNTLSVNDMVTYDKKYNDDNGHNNTDGTDENYSWNCGVEGITKSKNIQKLRIKQIKNAYAMLLLCRTTPMIYAGDEMCHSTNGNNNPYCQDNAVSYINWKDIGKNKEIYEFVKTLIELRKVGNRVNWSLHGLEPWNFRCEDTDKFFAIMYKEESQNSRNIYTAFNMNDKAETFYLPQTEKGKKWKVLLSTDLVEIVENEAITLPAHTTAVVVEV